ncbi:hypothetical protein [Dinghuibacter silviterrae]|uniref:Uncharacterized protein n=1 Tax=Dinghuibacter silviterrae TaxID=1539049 RepID=A0A4R8DSK7_9BACT|nr:hypothetical protein [Dinghuibacter silviterrae]TDX00141.1 hypothetical protein EDB95_1158 [Dinghuibacter silviterrae]
MQKLLFAFAVTLLAAGAQAQSAKYHDAMKQSVDMLDTAHSLPTMIDLAHRFERIGDAEKTQSLPYYYAAYCQVMTTFLGDDKTKTDEIADKAETLISKAEGLDKPTSETYVVRSMIATAHLMVDPQNRYMQYGAASGEALRKSEQLDSTNPRPVYLEGQSKFYTPEAFGGGKTVAKPVFEKALSMFGTFKPASDIAPRWGQHATEYFLSLCN